MSSEKTIKQQTKKLLTGNWGTVIASVIFACVVFITIENLSTLTAFLLGVYNGSGELVKSASKENLLNYINIGEFVLLIFLSPVFNGIIKMLCNLSLHGKTEIFDMFFYFKSGYRYFRTCIFNLILSSIFMLFSSLIDFAYSCLEDAVGKNLQDIANFDIISVTLIITMVVAVALKILFYLIFVHYQIFTYATFDNISILKSVFGMYGFAFRHLGSAIKMLFSFAGWILLCFFVVPAFYVLPYLTASMANSAKWLFMYDKDRGLLC